MENVYQSRTFLLLEDYTEQNVRIQRILQSPLGLAQDISVFLFQENLRALEQTLDRIKKFAAGISRANQLAPKYTLAGYYALMFSFHQFIHSSYRARQGKVLEEVFRTILREHTHFSTVPNSVRKERAHLPIGGGLGCKQGIEAPIDPSEP